MKKNYRKFRILTVIVFILMYSLASAADKVVIFPYNVSARNAVTQYKIGDTGPAGGIVFFVHTDGQYGLEAAPADQSDGIRWYNGLPYTFTEARGDGVGAGDRNTTLIVGNQGYDSNDYAAGICANLVISNAGIAYGDWYLPSREELNILYGQKNVVGGFVNSGYWSSTENFSSIAYYQDFTIGTQAVNAKQVEFRVRAIRAF